MTNIFLKIYFAIGIVIFILLIISICIINVRYINQHTRDYKNNKDNDFVRRFEFKTIKNAFFGFIYCILFSFILWPVAVISNIFNKRR